MQELSDSAPNFIIVYDLQSGTLFKKWKPERNSCSIAISSQGGCVVNGLDNCFVLVWDLATGARRCFLLLPRDEHACGRAHLWCWVCPRKSFAHLAVETLLSLLLNDWRPDECCVERID